MSLSGIKSVLSIGMPFLLMDARWKVTRKLVDGVIKGELRIYRRLIVFNMAGFKNAWLRIIN